MIYLRDDEHEKSVELEDDLSRTDVIEKRSKPVGMLLQYWLGY